jgi:hypothetical protein
MRAELEQAMAGFAERHGVIDPSPRKMLSILNMTRLFRARELISPEVSALLDDIRTIGNAAAHGGSDKIFSRMPSAFASFGNWRWRNFRATK